MADEIDTTTPVKKTTKKAPAKKAEHPPVATMVTAAISDLKDRKGSSLSAIKKYIITNYKVDIDRLAPFIRKFLKKAVEDGKLTQTKGSGASGSFKLSKKVAEEKPKVTKKPATKAKKPKSPTKPKKAATKPKKATKSPKKAKPAAKKTPKKAVKKTPKKESKAKKPAAKKAAKKTAKKNAK